MTDTPPLLVGVDAGTTRIRALVFTPNGQLLAEDSTPTPTDRPQPNWAQHDPDALWQATVAAIRQALAQLDHSQQQRIVSIGVASVAEAMVPLDAHLQPLAPVIAWFDERTEPQVQWLEQHIGSERLYKQSGILMGPMFSLGKMLWLQDNQPTTFAETRHWLNIADYINWRLTGVMATDYSQAARTLLLDLENICWADELLHDLPLNRQSLPELQPSGTRLGTLTAEAAQQTGLPEHCVVGIGGHDHIIGAFAIGAWRKNTLFDSLGTAEALLLAQDKPSFKLELMQQGYAQGVFGLPDQAPTYFIGSGVMTSGACVEWFRQHFTDNAAHDSLIKAAEIVPPGSLGAWFIPHMRGIAAPLPDAHARGAFLGLSPDNHRASLYRALLEGLAYDSRYVIEGLTNSATEHRIKRILAIGGDSRNYLLMQIKAAVFEQEITIVELSEAVSLGAALLGGLAANVFADSQTALKSIDLKQQPVKPDTALVANYQQYFQQYRQVAVMLAELHRTIRTHAFAKPKP